MARLAINEPGLDNPTAQPMEIPNGKSARGVRLVGPAEDRTFTVIQHLVAYLKTNWVAVVTATAAIVGAIAASVGAWNSTALRRRKKPEVSFFLEEWGPVRTDRPCRILIARFIFKEVDTAIWRYEKLRLICPRGAGGFDVHSKTMIGEKPKFAEVYDLTREIDFRTTKLPGYGTLGQPTSVTAEGRELRCLIYVPDRAQKLVLKVRIHTMDAKPRTAEYRIYRRLPPP